VFPLFVSVFGVAEIDEVEIDAGDLRVATVRPAKIRVADFLGPFVRLMLEVVGVEPGAAPFASNWTADQATAR
jgi:hypothetical protein